MLIVTTKVFATLLLLIVAIITFYSLHLLIVCAEETKTRTYQDVAQCAYGKHGALMTKIVSN